jgi:FtsP/CotA-like multicopper oxidase with cupredoxin domain
VLKLGIAERIDAFVEMNNPGVWILGAVDDASRTIGLVGIVVEYAGRSGAPVWIPPAAGAAWDYAVFGADGPSATPEEVIPLVIDRIAPGPDGVERWTINGTSYLDDPSPRILGYGRRYRLAIENRTDEEHPLHLHRCRFELGTIDGRRTRGVYKDVVLVGGSSTMDVDFTADQTGLLLFHCHQQLHMDSGFKTLFRVVP